MGAAVLVIEAYGLGEVLTRGVEISAGNGLLRAAHKIISRPRRGRGNLAGGRALLLEGLAQRVVAFTQLRIELDRLLESRRGGGEILVLPQRLPELVPDAGLRRLGRGDTFQVF